MTPERKLKPSSRLGAPTCSSNCSRLGAVVRRALCLLRNVLSSAINPPQCTQTPFTISAQSFVLIKDRFGINHLKITVFIGFQNMSGSSILKESNERSSSVFTRLESSDNVGLAFNHILSWFRPKVISLDALTEHDWLEICWFILQIKLQSTASWLTASPL